MAATILTSEGVAQLEEKLEYLKTVRRAEISQKIKEARAFGDISENAEYDEAKTEQARIEGEILELEKKLRNASVIDTDEIDTSVVSIGSLVKIKDMGNKETLEYTIVGSTEASPAKGRISNESPVGATLLGHKKGETVEVNTPGGTSKYKILEITKG